MSGRLLSAAINFNASGDNTVVSATGFHTIRIFGLFFTVAGATNITFKDGANSLSAAVVFSGSGSSMTLQPNDNAFFICKSGDFIMNNSNAVQVSGTVYYQAV